MKVLFQFLHTHYAYTINFDTECLIYRSSVCETAAYTVQNMGFKFKNSHSLHKKKVIRGVFLDSQKWNFRFNIRAFEKTASARTCL